MGTIGFAQLHGSPNDGVGSLCGLCHLVLVGFVPFVPLEVGIAVGTMEGTDVIGTVVKVVP